MAPDGPAPVDVVLTASAAAPPSVVWRALVDPVIRSGWWPDTDLDPTAGGRFEERWTDPSAEPKLTTGTVEAASRSRSLRLRWADTDRPAQTTVTIDLVPLAAGTEIRLRHTGFERLPDAAGVAADHRAGWQIHLAHLATAAEGVGRSS